MHKKIDSSPSILCAATVMAVNYSLRSSIALAASVTSTISGLMPLDLPLHFFIAAAEPYSCSEAGLSISDSDKQPSPPSLPDPEAY